ncbi:hypothetical protein P875_00053651 [Aspergillus parasiticus SU-1]|uniref:Uncharacterized protein n=1 Tax=Aspergillus parasiticus (strain ATCC 56775 / NRRL 5862 / SRRC 143 / SU-1) TaxID=1403190 RepID=A0A0F0HZ04_ASPPU|nr:hypothetical protein P875_00053651 [Aspergillus parasiticus SU-1]
MARFVEATTVQSPTGPANIRRSPFADPPGQSQTPLDVSDVGFGYVAANDSVQHVSHYQLPASPLKSALKVPGTPGRTLNPLSPTFREEFYVEKEEKSAEKENARDLNEKANGSSQDLWGWSCKKNTRETLFHNDIDYALLCRLQDWGLVCAIIEVVLEVLVILIYAVVFYRFWTKRRLMKSMDRRDKARSDLYLAQLRLQSAPNTPGFSLAQKTPIMSTTVPQDPYSMAENGESCSTQFATPRSPTKPQPTFQLQAPPIRVQQATPKTEQREFLGPSSAPTASGPASNVNQHMAAAPGERTYDAVPIPNAYSSPMSPTFPHTSRQ